MPVLVIKPAGYSFLYFLEPAIRQNSYGLYIVERAGDKIRKGEDSMTSYEILSG